MGVLRIDRHVDAEPRRYGPIPRLQHECRHEADEAPDENGCHGKA